MEWLRENWIMLLAVGLPILVDILNKVTAHWSEKKGFVKLLGFVVEVLNIVSLRLPRLRQPAPAEPSDK